MGRRVVMLAGSALGLALLGGMATGARAHEGDPGDLSLIHACVATKDGAVRIVGPIGACDTRKEAPAHWPAGLSGRFVDLGHTIFDTQTRLLWEKKAAGSGCLHCVSDMYSWCQATGNSAVGTDCEANTYSWIAQVSGEVFAGFSDWRVPTTDELMSIVDTGRPSCGSGTPCIDSIFGPTASCKYWSTSEMGDPRWAEAVDFTDGDYDYDFKVGLNCARAVRGGP
jgi:hypothetical protein